LIVHCDVGTLSGAGDGDPWFVSYPMKTRHVAALASLSIAVALIAIVSLIGPEALAYLFIALEPTRHQNAIEAANLYGTWAVDCGRPPSPRNMHIAISSAPGFDGSIAYRSSREVSPGTFKVLSADLRFAFPDTRLTGELTGGDENVGYMELTQLSDTGQRNLVTLALAIGDKPGEWGKMTVAAWQRVDGTLEIRNGIRSADQTPFGWLMRCGK
jgi:hypothetical protein